jgi:hypothetical protein
MGRAIFLHAFALLALLAPGLASADRDEYPLQGWFCEGKGILQYVSAFGVKPSVPAARGGSVVEAAGYLVHQLSSSGDPRYADMQSLDAELLELGGGRRLTAPVPQAALDAYYIPDRPPQCYCEPVARWLPQQAIAAYSHGLLFKPNGLTLAEQASIIADLAITKHRRERTGRSGMTEETALEQCARAAVGTQPPDDARGSSRRLQADPSLGVVPFKQWRPRYVWWNGRLVDGWVTSPSTQATYRITTGQEEPGPP